MGRGRGWEGGGLGGGSGVEVGEVWVERGRRMGLEEC